MSNEAKHLPSPPMKRRRGSMQAPPMRCLTLSNAVEMPALAFGTAFFPAERREPEIAWHAVRQALDMGYRHIDTAHMYGNERQVGDTLGRYFAEGLLCRDDVFITTKVAHPPVSPLIPTEYMLPSYTESSGPALIREFHGCLERLGVGFVDCLLVHWPGPFGVCGLGDPETNRRKRREMWAAMEDIYSQGLARSIGVSNFSRRHLEELLGYCKVKPHINQIEVHPYLQQSDLASLCKEHGIAVTAYSPLTGAKVDPGPLEEPVVKGIAERLGATPGQVVLKWLLQRDIGVLPKSSDAGRMLANLKAHTLADLTAEELHKMGELDRGLHTCADSDLIP